MGTWPNAGRKVVTEIVAAAVRAWTQADRGAIAPSEMTDEATVSPREPPTDAIQRQAQNLLLKFASDASRRSATV